MKLYPFCLVVLVFKNTKSKIILKFNTKFNILNLFYKFYFLFLLLPWV